MSDRDSRLLAEAYGEISTASTPIRPGASPIGTPGIEAPSAPISDVDNKSIFQNVIDKFYQMTTIEEAKPFIIDFIKNNQIIRESEKRRIIMTASNIDDLMSLQQYITNSMLKYMGMGVIK